MNKKLVAIIFLILVMYFGGVFYYRDKFLNNVIVNDTNISRMTLQKANKKFGSAELWNEIMIKSDTDEFLKIKAEEIDYKYLDTLDLPLILAEQNQWTWFLSFFYESTYTSPILSDYNKDKVKNKIEDIKELNNTLLDASLVFSSKSDAFIIEPHRYEIKITKAQLFDLVSEGIEKRSMEVNIQTYIEQPALLDDDESLILLRNKANDYLDIKLKYDFEDREEVIQRAQIGSWIEISENEVVINSEKVREYVVSLAKKYDTYGKSRKFKTSTGQDITISGGSYGWLTHRGKTTDQLIEYIKLREDKTMEPVYSFTALIRNADDLGNSYVEIDLKQQMVYVYINGNLRVETQTVTGNPSMGYDTPTGVYPLNYKETDAILVGEDYASPVKYWMPFNGNIGLHDADWRDTFGENIYETNGSHGCVNLPPNKAQTIFKLVYSGMPVIVH